MAEITIDSNNIDFDNINFDVDFTDPSLLKDKKVLTKLMANMELKQDEIIDKYYKNDYLSSDNLIRVAMFLNRFTTNIKDEEEKLNFKEEYDFFCNTYIALIFKLKQSIKQYEVFIVKQRTDLDKLNQFVEFKQKIINNIGTKNIGLQNKINGLEQEIKNKNQEIKNKDHVTEIKYLDIDKRFFQVNCQNLELQEQIDKLNINIKNIQHKQK